MLNNQITNSIIYFGGTGEGIYCSGKGCAGTEAKNGAYQTWDQPSNQIHHNIFMLPTELRAALYTAVGNQGSVLCPQTGSTYATPGNCSSYYTGSALSPITPYCPTATQTLDANNIPKCLGLTGWLSTSAFPSSTYNGTDCTNATLSSCPLVSPPWGSFDYHQFALCLFCSPTSGINAFNASFTSQGTQLSSDGFQIGPCLKGLANCQNTSGANMLSIDSALSRTLYVCTGSCGTGPWPD